MWNDAFLLLGRHHSSWCAEQTFSVLACSACACSRKWGSAALSQAGRSANWPARRCLYAELQLQEYQCSSASQHTSTFATSSAYPVHSVQVGPIYLAGMACSHLLSCCISCADVCLALNLSWQLICPSKSSCCIRVSESA